MELHAQITGQGPALVILHGVFGSGDNWRTLALRWAERFTVIALDLPNHGRSPHTDILSYESMVEALLGFLDSHGIWRCHLLGHSMGGKVAMQLALQHPERLESLIVADMAPKENPQNHTEILDALCAADIGPQASRQSVEADLARFGIQQPSVRQFLLKSLSRKANGQGFAWRFNLPLIQAQYPNILRNVVGDVPADLPALFIYGGKSDYLLPEDQPEILRRFPKAQFYCIPAAGHWLHAEAPDEFYAAVTDFLMAL